MAKTATSVPIRVEGDPNTIWIAPRKTFGVVQRVNIRAQEAGPEEPFMIALLGGFVQEWEGAAFPAPTLTAEQIADLPPLEDNPLLTAAVIAVLALWTAKPPPAPEVTDPDPNPAISPGGTAGTPTLTAA